MLFGEADMTEHHWHDVSVAKYSAGGDDTGKDSADDQIIADLHALERAIESRIPNAIAAILSNQLTNDSNSTVAWRLHRMAVALVSALFELAKTKPSLLRPIAETSEAFRGSVFFRNPDAAMAPIFAKLANLEIEALGPVSESGRETDSPLIERIRRSAEAMRAKWLTEEPATTTAEKEEFASF